MTYLRDIQRQKARSEGSGMESDVRNNCFGPSWYCRHVSLEYLSVHHPKQQTGFLIVNGIVVDISTVSNLVGIDIDGILHPLMLKNLRGYGRLARTIRPSNDNENGFMGGGYHATLIFWASCRICSKKRLVASSLVRFASSAASLINCERTASDGSSMLVNRYVSIVGFITMLFTISGAKVRN